MRQFLKEQQPFYLAMNRVWGPRLGANVTDLYGTRMIREEGGVARLVTWQYEAVHVGIVSTD